jgi:hypothetical protein
MGTMMRTGFVGAHSGVWAWAARLMAPSITMAEAQCLRVVWSNLTNGNPFMADFLVLSKKQGGSEANNLTLKPQARLIESIRTP